MTEQEIFEQLRPHIAEVTGVREPDIAMDSRLVEDLGAESIDLLDLTFLIEQEFDVAIDPNAFERTARERVPGGEIERDGVLTDAALAALREDLPEVDPSHISAGLRKVDIPRLLTVAVFVHVIQRGKETSHA